MSTQTDAAPTHEALDVQPVTIVVGYDGSDESREAVAVAAERAGRGGTVVVVPRHAVKARAAA